MGAETNCLHDLAGIAHAGEHYDLHARANLAQLLERLQSVDAGHKQVQEHKVGLQAFLHAFESLFPCACGFNLVLINFEKGANVPQHPRFIVDQQNIGRITHLFFPFVAAPTEGFKGMMKENLHPFPGSLSTQIFPPMAFTNRRAMASPNPIPS